MKTKTLFILLLIIGTTLIYALAIYPELKRIDYRISDYSCEEIKQSIIDGTCLIRTMSEAKTAMFVGCFSVEQKTSSYELRCVEEQLSEGDEE